MKHLSGFKMMALPLLGTGLAISCIDNSYDLDDVDYTLGVETDLTLPTCSTDTIYLRNFMDLKEDGVIQFVWDADAKDSVFCVKQSGEANVDPIEIAEIRIKKPAISSFNTTVPLKSLIEAQGQQAKRIRISIDTPFGPQTVDFEQEFEYVLDPQDARYAISPATANGISADIIRIDRVGINTLKATLQIHLIGFPDYIQRIHFDDLTLTYPDGINVEECLFNHESCAPIAEVPAYQLTPTTDKTGMNISDGLLLELTFSGMEEGGAFTFDPAKHSATFQGNFSLTGTVRILTDEFAEDKLKAELERIARMDINQLNQIIQNKDLTSLVPAEINIKGSAEMDKDIVLTTFSGSITHNVDRIDPIKLDDLPDFLNDEEVVLDLDNPLLLFNVNSQVIPIKTGLTLTSNTCDTAVVANNIIVDKDTTYYYMADKEVPVLPEGYKNATYLATKGSIPALIRKIPDQINVEVAPCTVEATDFDLTKTYDIDINYDVFAPLTFGPEFLLVYRDTENDWAKDLDDLEDVDADSLELSGLIDNELPASFTFTIEPIDRNGDRITQLLVDEISIGESGKNQPFKVSIKATEGHSINEALAGKNGVKQLDGIRYSARLKGQNGQTLYRKAAIKIHDIKAALKGMVKYNAN